MRRRLWVVGMARSPSEPSRPVAVGKRFITTAIAWSSSSPKASRTARRCRPKSERLQAECDRLQQRLQQTVVVGPEELERFAVTSHAMGVSLRQAEELLQLLLPAERVPDHATLGRWTQAAGQRAGEVLQELDPRCAPAAATLAVDEIFFGG